MTRPSTGERYPDEKNRIPALQMMTAARGREARHLRDVIIAEEDYNNLWKHTAIRDNYPVVVPPISDERSDETDDEKKLTTYLLKQATERQRIRKRDFEKSEDARKSFEEEVKDSNKDWENGTMCASSEKKPISKNQTPYTGERYPDESKGYTALQMMTAAEGREAKQVQDSIHEEEQDDDLWRQTAAITDNLVEPALEERFDLTEEEKDRTIYLEKQAAERQRLLAAARKELPLPKDI